MNENQINSKEVLDYLGEYSDGIYQKINDFIDTIRTSINRGELSINKARMFLRRAGLNDKIIN